jgi:hypothetical protein
MHWTNRATLFFATLLIYLCFHYAFRWLGLTEVWDFIGRIALAGFVYDTLERSGKL